MHPHERIIVALDGIELQGIARICAGRVGMVKLNDALDHFSAQMVAVLRNEGVPVFADPKLYDIPNTMANRMAAYRDVGASFVTVHASAGVDGMRAAVEASGDTKVLAVTVLTSLKAEECKKIYGAPPEIMVQRFARMAREAGATGIVCSPHELEVLVQLGDDAPRIKVTPGIRPKWAAANDQKRITTPADAIRIGADYIVVGRPITSPPDGMTPIEATDRIADEIAPVS